MNHIEFREINEDNLNQVVKLSDTLTDNQKKCVAPNVYSIAQAYANQNIAWPRAIYDEDQLIGFIMLGLDPFVAEKEDYPVYWIWRLMLAKPFQSKGYGKLIIDKVVQKCKEDNIKYLYLSCHIEEKMPYQFYIENGFIDTKKFIDGEEVLKIEIK